MKHPKPFPRFGSTLPKTSSSNPIPFLGSMGNKILPRHVSYFRGSRLCPLGKRITPMSYSNNWLVVWLPFFLFPYIGNLIIPIDEVIFFRGVAQPPTRQHSQNYSQKTWTMRHAQTGQQIDHKLPSSPGCTTILDHWNITIFHGYINDRNGYLRCCPKIVIALNPPWSLDFSISTIHFGYLHLWKPSYD